jgi:hypothetical protein
MSIRPATVDLSRTRHVGAGCFVKGKCVVLSHVVCNVSRNASDEEGPRINTVL